jgi:CubicO group peptidase (beta-lactamase class C family)
MTAVTCRLTLVALLAATPLAAQRAPDDLDRFVQAQMAQRKIPGRSLAILHDGKIEARAYGVRVVDGSMPVDTTTLFQSRSISKSVAALGALHLVEQHKLGLDTDVNAPLGKGGDALASVAGLTEGARKDDGDFNLMAHLTSDGLVTDVDALRQ